MSSIDIFVENLDRIAKHYNLKTYREVADYLNVTEDALKHWKNKSRSPSLKKIDEIGDRIQCHSYSLLQKEGELFIEIEYIKNNSRNALLSNLREYFMQHGKFSWNDKLKADDTLEWIGRMSDIQACAREIVNKEMIYQ